ncbi:MAG: hypothetical protein A2Y15_03825 [Clostridiales bacterium GWF2_36_10]|nr:MAG: hypothetical protein A2Y15_03825 [Clostridiales bacterium GWF2_36_10]HAN22088.1 DUF368 domain-containing protein [Clostridiales bacterium]
METNLKQKDNSSYDNMSVGQFVLHVLQGILIGGGAIIPGISGGVLCVVFGIYQPMMAMIAHPFKSLRTYIKLFIPIIIGGFIGFVGLAKVMKLLIEASPSIAYSLFIGLVAGTIPALFKDAGKQGTSVKSWTGFVISLFFVFAFLSFVEKDISVSIVPNSWWYLFSGVLWGLSLVVPGLSTSSILVYMGLYEPMMGGVGDFNLGVIIPLFIGIAGIALISARFVNYVYERHFSIISHAILGVVLSSTLLIVTQYVIPELLGMSSIIISVVCFSIGFIIAWSMDRFGNKVKK